MNHRTIAALADAVAPVIKEAFAAGMKPVLARIVALEERKPEKGERGLSGADGADGLNGKDGVDGFNGKDGAAGLNGKDGSNGVDGLSGKDGSDGLNGKDGEPGRDGVDGKDGAPGEPGLNGKDGADAPAPTIEQITDAVRALDADSIVRRALTADSQKGGIDVLAPDDVFKEMRSAVLLLAEPAPVKKEVEVESKTTPAPKPRTFRFDRDAQNRIVAAHEEFEELR